MQWLLDRALWPQHGQRVKAKGVSGAPRGCGLYSGRGDPMLKGCQLGFCHGWCALKTRRLLCLRAELSEAVKCSLFSLLVPCFFGCCVDWSVTSSLSPRVGNPCLCEFAPSLVSWLCAQRQIGACSGVCMSDRDRAGPQFNIIVYPLSAESSMIFSWYSHTNVVQIDDSRQVLIKM